MVPSITTPTQEAWLPSESKEPFPIPLIGLVLFREGLAACAIGCCCSTTRTTTRRRRPFNDRPHSRHRQPRHGPQQPGLAADSPDSAFHRRRNTDRDQDATAETAPHQAEPSPSHQTTPRSDPTGEHNKESHHCRYHPATLQPDPPPNQDCHRQETTRRQKNPSAHAPPTSPCHHPAHDHQESPALPEQSHQHHKDQHARRQNARPACAISRSHFNPTRPAKNTTRRSRTRCFARPGVGCRGRFQDPYELLLCSGQAPRADAGRWNWTGMEQRPHPQEGSTPHALLITISK